MNNKEKQLGNHYIFLSFLPYFRRYFKSYYNDYFGVEFELATEKTKLNYFQIVKKHQVCKQPSTNCY